MKSVLATILLFSALLLQNVALQAQGVYVTQGEKGPVFSDKPQPGAREVSLPPLNVVAPPQEPKAAATGNAAATSSNRVSPDATAVAYRTFSIVSPESDGSVVANTALFEVRVAVDPPLQLGEGHVFAVSINGRPVSQRFTANEFMIPPEFWGDALPPPNQSMQLDASIVDGDGRVLKRAAPVRFFMRHATLLNRPKRLAPPPITPERPVAPKPAMAPDKAVGATMK
ncbi:hypothetical protein [Propionivibrio sp.]|uniref:hypothetical protein n=1 Tax=Propionivibrio sp. TaxID=2212460 RepID=UPI00261B3959|nr:hypothetical protein [Propionivibrio sp.]